MTWHETPGPVPSQPDGIDEDSGTFPAPDRAVERILRHVESMGDGLYSVAMLDGKPAPLYARDLESLCRSAQLVEEARTRLEVADQLITELRAAAATPKPRLSHQCTVEQEESARLNEARVDWPRWIQMCDPAVSTDGDTTWLSCTGDARADTDRPTPICTVEPGDRWSDLVPLVVGHRCGETPDAPPGIEGTSVPDDVEVIVWDGWERINLSHLADVVRKISGGRVHLHQFDTENEEVLVISSRKLTEAEIFDAYRGLET